MSASTDITPDLVWLAAVVAVGFAALFVLNPPARLTGAGPRRARRRGCFRADAELKERHPCHCNSTTRTILNAIGSSLSSVGTFGLTTAV